MTSRLYSGWHHFHCKTCMDFIVSSSAGFEPLEMRRAALLNEINNIYQYLL